MKTDKKLNYTIKFKDGGYEFTAHVKSNDIVYAIKAACKQSELCSAYIISIEAI
jgi:hypothetical protein